MRKLIAIAIGAAAVGLSYGQGRSVNFTSLDAINLTGQGTNSLTEAGPTETLNSTTQVDVYSYLQVVGNSIGSTVDVTGWGSGSQFSAVTFLDIYHNETLNLAWSGINHAVKQSGTATGNNKVNLFLRAKWLIYPGGVETTYINTGGYVPYPGTNGAQTLGALATGGHIRFEYQRRADVTADNGPGVYENVATLTIQRS